MLANTFFTTHTKNQSFLDAEEHVFVEFYQRSPITCLALWSVSPHSVSPLHLFRCRKCVLHRTHKPMLHILQRRGRTDFLCVCCEKHVGEHMSPSPFFVECTLKSVQKKKNTPECLCPSRCVHALTNSKTPQTRRE